nr:hypothetical protein [uncultured Pseudomonas sp.]
MLPGECIKAIRNALLYSTRPGRRQLAGDVLLAVLRADLDQWKSLNQLVADISLQLKRFTDNVRFSSAMALAKLAGLAIFSSVFFQ